MKKITNTSKTPKLDWLFGGNPRAIEAQEAEGQKELTTPTKEHNAIQLPLEVKNTKYKGIKFIKEVDDLFGLFKVPAGWKLDATDHSMHNDLLDEKGRKRAGVFYKAAFYDRKAGVTFNSRINYRVDRLAFLEGDYSIDANGEYKGYKTPYVGRVTDYDGKILFETEHLNCDVEYCDYGGGRRGYTPKYKEDLDRIESLLKDKCLLFLSKSYPDFQNVNAYW